MQLEPSLQTRHHATSFTPLSEITRPSPEQDLMATQIRFGLTYVEEARCARASGRAEYYAAAWTIAWNAHSTALRFASRLPGQANASISSELANLKAALDELPPVEPAPLHSNNRRRCIRRVV